MTNFRWTAILAVVALALLAWFYSLNQDQNNLDGLIKKQETPEYIGHKMQTEIYAPTGKKQYLALSDKVEYYEFDGHTDFQQPEVFAFETENPQTIGQQSWKLTADKATLKKDNMLYLNGNVVLQSLMPASKLQRVESEFVLIDLKTQDISSDKMVKINGLNFHSQGLKLNGNLKQQVANLKEQVKTFYQISPKDSNSEQKLSNQDVQQDP